MLRVKVRVRVRVRVKVRIKVRVGVRVRVSRTLLPWYAGGGLALRHLVRPLTLLTQNDPELPCLAPEYVMPLRGGQ